MSFGYEGEDLDFVFRRPAERSRKVEFAETTERAAFVVSSVRTKHDWAGVFPGTDPREACLAVERPPDRGIGYGHLGVSAGARATGSTHKFDGSRRRGGRDGLQRRSAGGRYRASR